MKTVVLMTAILAVMAPVLAQKSNSTMFRDEYSVYQCNFCKQTRQVKKNSGPPNPYSGICLDEKGKKQTAHHWFKI